MAVHYRTQGIVLKKESRRDADELLMIYTKDFGKVEVLARAVKKIQSKLRAGTALFYLSEIEFIQGKKQKTLTDAILIDKFSNIRGDLKKLRSASGLADVLDELFFKEQKENKVWDLLTGFFQRLDDPGLKIEPAVIYYCFLWNLFAISGYRPELYNCSFCQKKLTSGKYYFGFEEGGVVCEKCFRGPKGQEISQSAIKIIRVFLHNNWLVLARLKIDSESQKILKIISKNYLSGILGRN